MFCLALAFFLFFFSVYFYVPAASNWKWNEINLFQKFPITASNKVPVCVFGRDRTHVHNIGCGFLVFWTKCVGSW